MEFLGTENMIVLGLKLGGGFLAAVAGIALWSQSREPGWVLVILATLLSYVDVVLTFLDYLGILPIASYRAGDMSWVRLGLAGGVPLLYTVGFLLILRQIFKP